ncbi:distal tail protein Dit [Oceanobacillus kimchii]|uniref:distal tail protein Dit n=1 Tax=Oceanobacillus kimchii TaxID=746691 RepID=UPI00034529F5|nr:distal tail protein Dit [Oceanobacillus kimchii]
MKAMTFNNKRDPNIILLEGRTKAPFHPISRNIVSTPKGHRLKDSKKELLYISQPIGYLVKDDVDALQIKDELAEWLVTKEIAPLQLDDEPGRTYWCVVQNSIDDLSRFVYTRQGTIQFLCFYTTGEQKTIPVTATPTSHTITGQDETPWTVEVVFSEATDTFELQTNKGLYLLLGYNFIEGDRLTIMYEGRKVWLNGEDLRHAVRLKTNYEMLEPGIMEVSASHDCKFFYDERYY